MQVNAILDPQIGFTLFDSYLNAVRAHRKGHHDHGTSGGISSPLVNAAFQAFNNYAATMEAGFQAQIAGLSAQLTGYAPNPQATGALTTKDIAPFLALNIMA